MTIRDVVRNERRQSYENTAFAAEQFAIGRALYPEGHPYRYLTIGLHEDIAGATMDDVRAWFMRWYGPGNATLLIAGDVDRTTARSLVAKWFGTLPGRPRETVADPFTRVRRVHYVWRAAKPYSDDDLGLDLLASVLGRRPPSAPS